MRTIFVFDLRYCFVSLEFGVAAVFCSQDLIERQSSKLRRHDLTVDFIKMVLRLMDCQDAHSAKSF